MPRQARMTSASSVYHAILRGVNKQQVFEDEEDYMHFLNVLRRQTQPDADELGQTVPPRCHVYAYCLMGNHVQGPLKASIVDSVDDYVWSSWQEYKGTAHQGFCSTSVVLERIAFADLKSLVDTPLTEEDASQFIDVDVHPTQSAYTDEEIWQLLSALCGASNATQFQALPRPQQKQHLFSAHEEGIGPRTLSRLTGVELLHQPIYKCCCRIAQFKAEEIPSATARNIGLHLLLVSGEPYLWLACHGHLPMRRKNGKYYMNILFNKSLYLGIQLSA